MDLQIWPLLSTFSYRSWSNLYSRQQCMRKNRFLKLYSTNNSTTNIHWLSPYVVPGSMLGKLHFIISFNPHCNLLRAVITGPAVRGEAQDSHMSNMWLRHSSSHYPKALIWKSGSPQVFILIIVTPIARIYWVLNYAGFIIYLTWCSQKPRTQVLSLCSIFTNGKTKGWRGHRPLAQGYLASRQQEQDLNRDSLTA